MQWNSKKKVLSCVLYICFVFESVPCDDNYKSETTTLFTLQFTTPHQTILDY